MSFSKSSQCSKVKILKSVMNALDKPLKKGQAHPFRKSYKINCSSFHNENALT